MDQDQAINKVKQLAGVEVDRPREPAREPEKRMNEEQKKEALSLVEKASLNSCEYYTMRGLTEKTIKKYRLGYLPEGIKKRGQVFKCVLPVSDNFIIYRKDDDQDQDRYHNEGNTEIFNVRYLEKPSLTGREIYVTEGLFDALSLEELDRPAVALNSTAMVNSFVEAATKNKEALQNKVFLLALDNDEPGGKAAQELKEGLQGAGLQAAEFSFNGHKDVSEYLINDREGLAKSLDMLPLKGSVFEYLDAKSGGTFWQELRKRAEESDIKTEIKGLDANLGGGLYPGLYVLGSISSLGKTALALQVADRIAEQGFKVMFFSLEMGAFELVCRSLTRTLFEMTGGSKGITTGNFIKNQINEPGDLFKDNEAMGAFKEYGRETAKNMTIEEGNFDLDVNKIREKVLEFKALTGFKPVVFVDYLQVLRPIDMRMNEKQAVDYNMAELKRISRDLDIPVFVVSSFNRMSYNNPADMAAFKESGAIEYTADVILAMQLRKNGDEDINELKNREPRPLQLVLLKNRRGRAYENIPLDYWPKVNYFTEA